VKLAELATKPNLNKIILDDEAIQKEYGEPVEFYMYDKYDMDTFMKLAQLKEDDIQAITEVVSEMVLDENGEKILVDGKSLPINVMMKVIESSVSTLGNAVSQTTQA